MARSLTLLRLRHSPREHDGIVELVFEELSGNDDLPHYQSMDPDRLRWYIQLIYNLLMRSIRTGERMSLLSYARYLAMVRKTEGVAVAELCQALVSTGETVHRALVADPRLAIHETVLNDHVRLTMQLVADEVEDAYDELVELPTFRRFARRARLSGQAVSAGSDRS